MKRKVIFGLCLLCMVAIDGVAAQGAMALGQTAYTCQKGGGALDFSQEHCISSSKVTAGTGTYGHVPITEKTKFTAASTGTMKLKSVQSGVTLELQATELTGSGELENKEEKNKKEELEMVARGTGVVTFKNVTVTSPAGKGCTVVGGQITTNSLTASTKELTNELRYMPTAGETSAFAEFTISGCSVTALNHVYVVKGSIKGQTNGATTNFSHANGTEQKTLTLGGQNAAIEGATTTKGPNGSGFALT